MDMNKEIAKYSYMSDLGHLNLAIQSAFVHLCNTVVYSPYDKPSKKLKIA